MTVANLFSTPKAPLFSTPGFMSTAELARLQGLPVEELRERARLPFRLVPTIADALDDFARTMVGEIRQRNAQGEPTRLILPVGPIAHYRKVVEICNRERISWRNVYTFNMDEFLDWQGRPVPLDHPLSFEAFMWREVFNRLDPALCIPRDHVFFPHPFRIDEISEKIQAVGGIDCCYGGIGYHGHIAFNEPPLSRWARISPEEMRNSLTRVVTVGEDSVVVQSIGCAGGGAAAIPPMGVTLGMKDILESRKLRLYLCGGERHRTVFRISVAGEVTSDYPSTLAQGHPDAEVITDVATAQPVVLGIR